MNRIVNASVFTVVVLFALAIFLVSAATVLGADVAPVLAATAPVPEVTFLGWVKANANTLLAVSLGISELLSMIPAFKGNGILDTIIKALQALSEKPEA
jgi:hypothetical protein